MKMGADGWGWVSGYRTSLEPYWCPGTWHFSVDTYLLFSALGLTGNCETMGREIIIAVLLEVIACAT